MLNAVDDLALPKFPISNISISKYLTFYVLKILVGYVY